MTYKVTDSRGRTNTATVSIAVTSVLAINGQPPNFGTVGTPYTAQLIPSGGSGGYTYALTGTG
ncbi:hypothetical protein, partial [Escherichia coli]|uniref:hypothetical protein n=1 Tax=Escherichia coli TaxID=562 RepID=UPI0013D7006C